MRWLLGAAKTRLVCRSNRSTTRWQMPGCKLIGSWCAAPLRRCEPSIYQAFGQPLHSTLAVYDVRILDGSHLCDTERRLGVHRMITDAPLPEQALVILKLA